MSRWLAVALFIITGCGARTDLDDTIANVADARLCNERFVNDGESPQLSVAAVSNGFVLAGSDEEAIPFGDHTLTSEKRALFVVRLDASCEVVWARQFLVDAYFVDLAATAVTSPADDERDYIAELVRKLPANEIVKLRKDLTKAAKEAAKTAAKAARAKA